MLLNLELRYQPPGRLIPLPRMIRKVEKCNKEREREKLTSGGMLAVSPATLAHQTIRYEYAAIQTIEPMNVTGKYFLPRGVRVSGSVNHNGKIIGATNK